MAWLVEEMIPLWPRMLEEAGCVAEWAEEKVEGKMMRMGIKMITMKVNGIKKRSIDDTTPLEK